MNSMTCRRSDFVFKLEFIIPCSPFLESHISLYGRLDGTNVYIYAYLFLIALYNMTKAVKHNCKVSN